MDNREDILTSLRAFKNSIGYAFLQDLATKHVKSKAQELGDVLRMAEKKNECVIYRLSGYLDGFENGMALIETAISEVKEPNVKEDKPIY